MPYDLFWHGPISAFFIYADKNRLEKENQRNNSLDIAWLVGDYVRLAMLDVYKAYNPLIDGKKSPNYPYPQKPYRPPKPLTDEEKAERKMLTDKMKRVNAELGVK